MRNIDWECVWLYVVGIIPVLVMIYAAMCGVDKAANRAECIDLGYPKVSNTWNLRTYCVDDINIHREDKVRWLE